MTYKEVVNKFSDLTQRHLMINQFGYGNISDIKVTDSPNKNVNYPYLFLNPTIHGRLDKIVLYRFNFIMMDLVKAEDELKIQSECMQYIDDIIAKYNEENKITQINLENIQYQVFKERFQDEVAGATATMEIVSTKPIDDCIVPF